MITITHRGSFRNVDKFLESVRRADYKAVLDRYGSLGVSALEAATPVDSGLTANSWSYSVKTTRYGYSISWTNSNVVNGVPIAILIQYGHATRNGTYVSGRDFINPALRPIFDGLAEKLWKEVTHDGY